MNQDIKRFGKGKSRLAKPAINKNMFSALVSFACNCGLDKLKEYTSYASE
ncbi:glycoside hydrolase family protein [Pontibacter pamirensis]